MLTRFIISIALVLHGSGSFAQIDSALAAQLQDVLNTQVTSAGNHGVSAHLIFQNGQTWTGTAGVDGLNMPMTDTTVFIGASTSKMHIAILLLLLAEDGLVSLDDSWRQYLPALNAGFDTSITIRQLLNHTSGITDYLEVPANYHYITDDFSAFYTPQDVLENIVSSVPDFAPGTNFNYSNSNYLLAAYVAEAVTPNPIEAELRTRIWNPLGLNHTYFGGYDSITDPMAGVWWNFGSGLTNYSSQSYNAMMSYGYGTDNVVTTPKDLATLVHALLNNQLINTQSLNEMLAFVPQSFVNQWVAGYGLGIHHLLGQTVDTLLGHDGKFCNLSDVFHSQMCGFTLATMTNTETFWQGIYNAMYDVIRNYFQCNSVPVANFYAGTTDACEGATITFYENSTNAQPTAWNWNFPGGVLTNGTTVTDSIPQVIYYNAGTYDVSLTVSTSAGSDSVIKNSYISIFSNIPVHDTSFTEGFETATLPNTYWSISNTNGHDWDVTSLGAATGTKSVYIDNFLNTPGNKSSLKTNIFDISGIAIPRLSFKLAYRQRASGNNDKLQVFTSTNCGASWTMRFTRSGSALATVTPPAAIPFAPTSGDFTDVNVSISNVAGSQNVRFKFEFTADIYGPGNNIFIDDINIYDGAVGIETVVTAISVEAFPNPTAGAVTISSAEIMDELKIIDLLGQVTHRMEPIAKNTSLTIPDPGMYFIMVKSGELMSVRKLLVYR